MSKRSFEWVLMGSVMVDSGQLLITDPCYLKDWKGNEVNFKDKIRDTLTNEEIDSPRKVEGITYESIYKDGLTYNQAIKAGRLVEIPEETNEYSYDGCCKKRNNHFVDLENGAGICFSSGFGDGCYEVWGKLTDMGDLGKRITEVKIKCL